MKFIQKRILLKRCNYLLAKVCTEWLLCCSSQGWKSTISYSRADILFVEFLIDFVSKKGVILNQKGGKLVLAILGFLNASGLLNSFIIISLILGILSDKYNVNK